MQYVVEYFLLLNNNFLVAIAMEIAAFHILGVKFDLKMKKKVLNK
jgi:hypothetical protein